MVISDKLTNLGLDNWFQLKIDESKLSSFELARVSAVNKTNYLVFTSEDEITSELSGKFLFSADTQEDYPAVGDWVYIQNLPGEHFSIIHDIVTRKNLLKRKSAGKKSEYQVIAANIDTAFIMQALDADYNIRRLERYLVMITDSGIEPILLLSKSDLLEHSEVEEKKKKILEIYSNLKIITFSNTSSADVQLIRDTLQPQRTYCLLGSSGVGKSTLLNNLFNKDLLKTQSVKEKDHKGKHTTTRRELFILDNGAIILDTPGMRELGIVGAEAGFEDAFSEITALIPQCRFKDCTHTIEEGCAVLKALETGAITKERYQSYRKVYKEAVYNEMSYVEKRQKDKKFGKFVKSVLKHKKDKR